jgi:hypothetical protein
MCVIERGMCHYETGGLRHSAVIKLALRAAAFVLRASHFLSPIGSAIPLKSILPPKSPNSEAVRDREAMYNFCNTPFKSISHHLIPRSSCR